MVQCLEEGDLNEVLRLITEKASAVMGAQACSLLLKEPETDHLFQLYSLFAGDRQRQELAATYRRGGFGYGEVKKALADLAADFFAPARQRRQELEAHPARVREILGDGAARARKKAAEVLARAQAACGVGVPGG